MLVVASCRVDSRAFVCSFGFLELCSHLCSLLDRMLPCQGGELPFTFAGVIGVPGFTQVRECANRVPVSSTLTDIICWVVGLGLLNLSFGIEMPLVSRE